MRWRMEDRSMRSVAECVVVIIAGCGVYGFALGLWRHPMQGLFVAVKLPVVILATLAVNGLLNGILAQLFDGGMRLGQTLRAQLHSFALFSLIVGSLSPLAIFAVLDAPEPGSAGARSAYSALLVIHCAIIAWAGILANLRLFHVIRMQAGSARSARNVLLGWLAGNLFAGAQISFILRPFFGQPSLKVQFLRPDAFRGNFWESLWFSARQMFSPSLLAGMLVALGFALLLCVKKRVSAA
jgi:hypothetical protein